MESPDVSIVIPLFDEEKSLQELYEWISKVVEKHKISYEIIFVDDGSNDGSWEVIQKISKKNVIGIRLRSNYGKATALSIGFENCKAKVIITMDADLQDNPEEIPELYRLIKDEKYDLVSGWKKKRFDPISKTWPTKIFNKTLRIISKIPLHDFNSGIKSYRSEVAQSLSLYGERHRYIPLLAYHNGFKKIGEKVVKHHRRKYGISKYGYNRFIYGFLDLLSVVLLTYFIKKPMHFFGSIGIISFFTGFIFTLYIIIEKIYKSYCQIPLRQPTEQPIFYMALVFLIIGTQLFLTGLLGELIIHYQGNLRKDYIIQEKIGTN